MGGRLEGDHLRAADAPGELLMGGKVREPSALDPGKLDDAATPRLWYLAPQSELAGVFKAAGR